MNFQPGQETLAAVVIGALLATIGGFAESQLEGMLRRRERERSAALLFGELLSTLKVIVELAEDARGRGDPYGPITMRFLRAARRETEIYDRNRETLPDLRNPAIRAQIQYLYASVTFSIEGIFDAGLEIAAAERLCEGLDGDDPVRLAGEARIEELRQNRQGAFDFAIASMQKIDGLVLLLKPLARHDFQSQQSALRGQ